MVATVEGKSGIFASIWLKVLFVLLVLLAHFAIAMYRDNGYGGPHHDEVIALLASNALETEYGRIKAQHSYPIGHIVPASEWHRFTTASRAVSFHEIAEDVLRNDKHPPLAFWVMNRFLRLFPEGRYQQAVLLTWGQVVLAGAILGLVIYRQTGSSWAALLGFSIFLFGNSAVFTSIWVRQYALFAICYAGVMLVAAELASSGISLARVSCLSCIMALFCVAGMLTQYTFSLMSGPIHLALLWSYVRQKRWDATMALAAAYLTAAVLFLTLLPGALAHARSVSEGLERQWQWTHAFGGLPTMYVPLPSSVQGLLRLCLGVVAILVPLGLWVGAIQTCIRSDDRSLSSIAVVAAGVLGAGVGQFILVAAGWFPKWATGENHMVPLWQLTVFLGALFLHRVRGFGKAVSLCAVLFVLIGMQLVYTVHLQEIRSRVNTVIAADSDAELVLLDNLDRGYVLQVTDVLKDDQLVLASAQISESFRAEDLPVERSLLYLPMESSVSHKKSGTLSAALDAGYKVSELPVVHRGMYEAVELVPGIPE